MKIQTSTNVRHGQGGKRYHLPAGEHDVPDEVGEYLISKGHAKAVPAEVESPAVPAGARVIGQDAAVPVAAAPELEAQPKPEPDTEPETDADAENDLELELDVDQATGDEPETEPAAEGKPAGGRRGRRG